MASKVEEEFRRLSIEIRFFEETAQALQSRMNMVNAVITDLTYANTTLEGVEKNKVGSELLVPVGGNSYIKANIYDPDKVIVGIGAGVSVEKTSKDAKETIKKRLEALDKTKLSLQQRFGQVAQKINEDRAKLDKLVAELRQGKSSRNV
ncbi:prefoldin subunit alpha [Candidatus Bathyarchaeota archaeon]|nr:prefoldin subunit alpha [Candidatus Bathyarchaeota archaeon]